MLRRRLYKIHKWMGLVTGVLLLVVSLSGVPLLFRKSLDRVTRPVAFHLQPGNERVPLNVLIAHTLHRYPGSQPVALELLTPPDEPLQLALRQAADSFVVFLDPYSGHILGDTRVTTPLSAVIYKLHTSLFLGRFGSILTTFLGLTLVFLALSGGYVYRAAWRNPFSLRPPNSKSRTRKLSLAYLHRVTGLWAMLFLLMTGLTGFWLNHESLFPTEAEAQAGQISPESMQDLQFLILKSQVSLNKFQPVSLVFPNDNSDTITIYGSLREGPFSFLYGLYAASVKVTGASGAVIEISTPQRQSFKDNLINLVYPLHSADFALGPTLNIARVFYTLAGLMPGLLFITGFITTCQRSRRTRRSLETTNS